MQRRFSHSIKAMAVAFVLSMLAGGHATGQDAISKQQKVPVRPASVVLLSPTNSSISFVGIHVGDDPKPRLGGFKKFRGYVSLDKSAGEIKSLVVDIQVDSVWTEFNKLTTHLMNADFFEVSKFPHASFESTSIEKTGEGACMVKGNLTLHGTTKPFSFPAKYEMRNGGLLMSGQFKIDRSMFGMDQMLSGVDKMVSVEISIGQKTVTSGGSDGHGGDSKKQSSKASGKKLQKVSVKLPNMT